MKETSDKRSMWARLCSCWERSATRFDATTAVEPGMSVMELELRALGARAEAPGADRQGNAAKQRISDTDSPGAAP